MRYRYVGEHAAVTGVGVPVGPGDFVELSDEEAKGEFEKDAIDSGILIEAPEEGSKSKSTKTQDNKEES